MTDLSFVHRFEPATSNGTSATLLLLHGTGGNEDDLIPLGQELLPGAALLSPRGKVLENGMPRFFRRLAEGVFDIDDLQMRSHELAAFLKEAREMYRLKGPFVAVGYSNGANIATSIMLMHPSLLAGGVLFRPMIPFVPQTPPALAGVQVLISSGNRDPIVPRSQPEELVQLLKSWGAIVSLSWHTGGHELGEDDIVVARKWIQEARFA